MYQLEVKAILVQRVFPPAEGWRVTVDVDAMERASGGAQPVDKLALVTEAFGMLEAMNVALGKPHLYFRRADIVAEHSDGKIVVVEAEGSSSRQPEQAMYAALGQLIVSMGRDGAQVSYAIAVPDEPGWQRQIEKIPLAILARLKMRAFFVSPVGVREYPDEGDVTDRYLLGDETTDVLPADAEDQLGELLDRYADSADTSREKGHAS